MAEISVRRFNENAVPHHLGLLRNHKTNIEKSLALHDWDRIKREEINATRVIKELKNLLLEMEELRCKVREEEVPKFDQATNRARRDAIEGIQEFVELKLRSPSKSSTNSLYDCPSDMVVVEPGIPTLQSDFQLSENQLKARESCLKECENLQREFQDIHGLFHQLHGTVLEQAEGVQVVHDNVEATEVNVQNGETQLRKALKYKKAMYPLCGAIIGSCIGGPVGLLVGLKAGGLAAVGCGILGFTGGTVLKKNEEVSVEDSPPPEEVASTAIDVHNKVD